MIKISPSILSADFGNLLAEVHRVEAGGADYLHIDVMDGHFVPNITIGPLVIEALRGKTSLPLEVHLMIENPDQFLDSFIRAGANLLSVQIEACTHLHRTIQTIRARGVKAGVAINPATSLTGLEYILDDLDYVLIMTVNPGFGGQAFIPAMLPKIRQLKEMITTRDLSVAIVVDGGINARTAGLVVEAGADILVAGQAVYGQPDVAAAIRDLRGQ